MNGIVISLIVLGVIALLVGLTLWGIYNGLIAGRNMVRESFSGIYVQLKRRADLIPNLVETVKSYAAHESKVLEEVTRLRTAFLNAGEHNASAAMEQSNLLSGALKSLFAVSENYPDLRASENFLELQEELAETEDQIAASRRIYNSNVNDYNTKAEQFPGNVVAKRFGFGSEPFFEGDSADQTVPKVSF